MCPLWRDNDALKHFSSSTNIHPHDVNVLRRHYSVSMGVFGVDLYLSLCILANQQHHGLVPKSVSSLFFHIKTLGQVELNGPDDTLQPTARR